MPLATGSLLTITTIGMAEVAFLTIGACSPLNEKITSGLRRTSSFARSGRLSLCVAVLDGNGLSVNVAKRFQSRIEERLFLLRKEQDAEPLACRKRGERA